MLTTRSLRDVTLATLLMFGASGCIIVQGTPYPSRPVNTTTSTTPLRSVGKYAAWQLESDTPFSLFRRTARNTFNFSPRSAMPLSP